MKKHLLTAVRMTVVTTILLGIIYPLAVTGLAQLFFRDKANGQLIVRDGGVAGSRIISSTIIGSRIIGQAFSGPGYFHSRPSSAGDGYDAANSGGSNLSPTNQKLISRVSSEVARLRAENSVTPIPVDLVTTSASGLDPDISLAAAEFQVPRIARERKMPEAEVRSLVQQHTQGRQFGLLGEPRVNVLGLNLALDDTTLH